MTPTTFSTSEQPAPAPIPPENLILPSQAVLGIDPDAPQPRVRVRPRFYEPQYAVVRRTGINNPNGNPLVNVTGVNIRFFAGSNDTAIIFVDREGNQILVFFMEGRIRIDDRGRFQVVTDLVNGPGSQSATMAVLSSDGTTWTISLRNDGVEIANFGIRIPPAERQQTPPPFISDAQINVILNTAGVVNSQANIDVAGVLMAKDMIVNPVTVQLARILISQGVFIDQTKMNDALDLYDYGIRVDLYPEAFANTIRDIQLQRIFPRNAGPQTPVQIAFLNFMEPLYIGLRGRYLGNSYFNCQLFAAATVSVGRRTGFDVYNFQVWFTVIQQPDPSSTAPIVMRIAHALNLVRIGTQNGTNTFGFYEPQLGRFVSTFTLPVDAVQAHVLAAVRGYIQAEYPGSWTYNNIEYLLSDRPFLTDATATTFNAESHGIPYVRNFVIRRFRALLPPIMAQQAIDGISDYQFFPNPNDVPTSLQVPRAANPFERHTEGRQDDGGGGGDFGGGVIEDARWVAPADSLASITDGFEAPLDSSASDVAETMDILGMPLFAVTLDDSVGLPIQSNTTGAPSGSAGSIQLASAGPGTSAQQPFRVGDGTDDIYADPLVQPREEELPPEVPDGAHLMDLFTKLREALAFLQVVPLFPTLNRADLEQDVADVMDELATINNDVPRILPYLPPVLPANPSNQQILDTHTRYAGLFDAILTTQATLHEELELVLTRQEEAESYWGNLASLQAALTALEARVGKDDDRYKTLETFVDQFRTRLEALTASLGLRRIFIQDRLSKLAEKKEDLVTAYQAFWNQYQFQLEQAGITQLQIPDEPEPPIEEEEPIPLPPQVITASTGTTSASAGSAAGTFSTSLVAPLNYATLDTSTEQPVSLANFVLPPPVEIIADGSVTTTFPDGSTTTVNPDGTKTTTHI